ncbi:TrbI/VirB10 family protein [Flavobacteriaceae bacterium]|nr:TrbI/VirB10 family protein [Flavobacteriaceae bacterium]
MKSNNQNNPSTSEDQNVQDQNIGDDISSVYNNKLKKNKIIIAITVVILCLVLGFIIMNGSSNKKTKPMEEIKAKSISDSNKDEEVDSDGSISSLGINEDLVVTEEKIESNSDIDLRIPPLPDLNIDMPKVVLPTKEEVIEKKAKFRDDFEDIEDYNNSYDEVLMTNGVTKKKKKPKEKEKNESSSSAQEEKKVDPRSSPIVLYGDGSGSGHPNSSMINEDNIVILNDNDLSKLKKSETVTKTSIVKNKENVIGQGKRIIAILETAINTEIPGFVRAVISMDVYPEQGNKALIPRGSRIYGSYSKDIQRGQERVNIAWTRMIRPDGIEVAINFSAADEFGRSGIKGSVDNKYTDIIKNSILSSMIAIGSGAVADLISGGDNVSISGVGGASITSSALTAITSDISSNLIDVVKSRIDAIDTSPLIRIPQGTKIMIIVQADLEMPALQNY